MLIRVEDLVAVGDSVNVPISNYSQDTIVSYQLSIVFR
jgi:hypothetical protein